MIRLRRATAADADAVRALVCDAYAPWVPVMKREPLPMTVDYSEAIDRHVIDLHHDDGVLAALIEMEPKPDHLLIVNVAVAPAFQGRGLGRQLLAHAERVAASFGLGEVRLYTNVLMAENVRLYLALGYQVDGEEPFMGGARVHMSKTVSQGSLAENPG